MIKTLHFCLKFDKKHSLLRSSEKMAVAASKNADAIIEAILKNGGRSLSQCGKLSRHGEFRIKNCTKYDLGKGYRMVCVKQTTNLYFLFIGTHDDCDAFIENNRDFTPRKFNTNRVEIAHISPEDKPCEDLSNPSEPDYDDLLYAKITEKDLLYVFRGLSTN